MRLCEKAPFRSCPSCHWQGTDVLYRHVKYTIPPAIALTILYRPLLTRLDIYKILFLVTV